MITWGERPYPGLCPSAVVELVKVDILYSNREALGSVSDFRVREGKGSRTSVTKKSAKNAMFGEANMFFLLQEGHRMERPHHCPPSLYSLMLDCWDGEVFH